MLDKTVDKLVAASERPDLRYQVTILNSPAVNAFALPNGQLYVTRGLIALANDQLRARLGAGARDGARDRPPRRDPRGPGAAGGAGQPRRERSAERSAARRAGARQIEDRARQLLARPGVRGRRHRRRHLGARRLRPLRRRALPHLDGAQRAAARAARQHRSARAGLPVVASGDARARHQRGCQCAAVFGTGRGRARARRISRPARRPGLRRGPERRLRARPEASCIPSSASPSPRRTASRSTTRRRRCSASRTAARRRCGSTWCGCRPSRRCRSISMSGWIENIDAKSVEELTVVGLPGGDRDRERRPVDVPALRGALRQRGLSRHLRGEEPHRRGGQELSAIRSTRSAA